jgi:hypothetical protein
MKMLVKLKKDDWLQDMIEELLNRIKDFVEWEWKQNIFVEEIAKNILLQHLQIW